MKKFHLMKKFYHEPHEHGDDRLPVVRAGSCWFVVKILILVLLLLPLAGLTAQEDFGFGDADFGFDDSGSGFGFSAPRLSVSIGGEVRAEMKAFFHDMRSGETFKNMKLGDVFSGSLNFGAGASFAQGVINLNLVPVFDGSSPVTIDEAYLRVFFGPVTVEGGMRKLSWGKADSFGPLDLINPLDYRDLSKLSDPQSVKIARPMLHASWAMGSFSKLEAVFVPWFQGHKFATTGRWAPGQVTGAYSLLASEIEKEATAYLTPIYMANLVAAGGDPDLIVLANSNLAKRKDYIQSEMGKLSSLVDPEELYPDTSTLKYAQGGLRFTTSIGSSDLGFQYYFGRLLRPAVNIRIDDGLFTPRYPSVLMDLDSDPIIHLNTIHIGDYNYYHHIGIDFARVIVGFNFRAEAGVNLTKDLDGKDGTVENPAIVWSLGFDRDLFWGINLNLQGVGKLRLLHSKIGGDLLTDCEAGSKLSSTRITGIISKKFLRDELELKTTVLWGIEDMDFLIIPSVSWSRNDVSAELSAGFFGGDEKGELGQYWRNSYIRVSLAYKF